MQTNASVKNNMELINKPGRLFDLENMRQVKYFILPIILCLTLFYSVYVLFDQETIRRLGLVREDGVYEYLTAGFFFLATVFFLKGYISNRNKFLLLLAIVMFFGAGEEISWGQRIIGFTTPELIREHNVQREFTFHNIEIFNNHTFDKEEKSGIVKLITINFLYKLFWLGYCVVLPIAFAYLQPVSWLAKKLQIPIPPLSIGVFFLINWLIFKVILTIAMLDNEQVLYRFTEVMEACSAFLFMTLGFFFLSNGPTAYVTDSSK